MNILSWNCRGSGGTTVSTLNRYLRCTKAQIAFISETRCGIQVAEGRIRRLPLCNSVVVPSVGKSGGLWLLWNDEVQIEALSESKNLIVADVEEKGGGKKWRLLAVYGDPSRVGNPRLWKELESYLQNDEVPVCLMGDLNAVVSLSEKWGDIDQLSNPNKAFRAWIHTTGLIDLGHHGPAYTWSNKQRGAANVSERLDRGPS